MKKWFLFLLILFLSAVNPVNIPAAGQKVSKNKGNPQTQSCPKCGSSQGVVPIVYGYPGEELMKKAQKGDVKLGGCIIGENNPNWHCNRCQTDW